MFFHLNAVEREQAIYYYCAERYHIQIVSFCLNKQNISFNNSFGLNRGKRATAHHVLEHSIWPGCTDQSCHTYSNFWKILHCNTAMKASQLGVVVVVFFFHMPYCTVTLM